MFSFAVCFSNGAVNVEYGVLLKIVWLLFPYSLANGIFDLHKVNDVPFVEPPEKVTKSPAVV